MLTSLASHTALFCLDRYAKRPAALPISPNESQPTDGTPTSNPSSSASPVEKPSDTLESAACQNPQPDGDTCPAAEEGSIAALRQKLEALCAEAKRLNSPDSFVAYARVTREANKVEKELQEKKALEPGDPLAHLDVTRLVSALLPSQTTQRMRRSATTMALKAAFRLMPSVLMLIYFMVSGRSTTVVTIDCRAVRPLTMLFRSIQPVCTVDDWQCAGQAPLCGVSSTVMGLFVSSAIGVLRHVGGLY